MLEGNENKEKGRSTKSQFHVDILGFESSFSDRLVKDFCQLVFWMTAAPVPYAPKVICKPASCFHTYSI